jgi:hypothetical protein
MNWDAIGAVGEVGGAIGVIITLVYLAGQLRQNTRALRSASYAHWNEVSSSFTDFVARYSGELSEMESFTRLEQLTPQHRQIQLAMGIKAVDQAQTAFLQHRAGTLDDDVFEARTNSFLMSFQINPLMQEAWKSILRDYPTNAFRDLIEGRASELKP